MSPRPSHVPAGFRLRLQDGERTADDRDHARQRGAGERAARLRADLRSRPLVRKPYQPRDIRDVVVALRASGSGAAG